MDVLSVKEAISKGNLRELLVGEDEYVIHNPYLDTPTEPMQVFNLYLLAFNGDFKRMEEFALMVLELSKDSNYGWFVVYYLMDILENKSAFRDDFDFQVFVNQVLQNVKDQKSELKKLKKWAGTLDPEGCWGIVDRFVGQLKKYNEREGLIINWD